MFLGVALIYLAYLLRAMRWKIFLRPVRRRLRDPGLLTPTIVGFTGLALLGRAGEMIRPYLIARHENLSFASQVAVWAVERIFDVGGFALLLVSAIFLPRRCTPSLQDWQPGHDRSCCRRPGSAF